MECICPYCTHVYRAIALLLGNRLPRQSGKTIVLSAIRTDIPGRDSNDLRGLNNPRMYVLTRGAPLGQKTLDYSKKILWADFAGNYVHN